MWTWTAILALLLLLLGYYQLREVTRHVKNVDENVARTTNRQTEILDELSKIKRILEFNSKQLSEDFSEAQVEQLLRDGQVLQAIMYRRNMSTESLEEAYTYIRGTAERLGISIPGSKDIGSEEAATT
jgi:hypothetical protein